MKRWWTGLIFLCWLAWLTGCATTGASTGQSSQATAGGDLITESDESDGRKRARVRLELAAGYLEQGQATVALDEVKQALVADPGFATAYNLRGLIYMRLNEPRLAESSFQRAMALAPKDAEVLHNLGWLYCQESRHQEAVDVFRRALAEPNYAAQSKTWMTLGICQARAGQAAQAEKSLMRSFELDAGNPITSYNLAALLLQRGDYPNAQFYIRRLNNSNFSNAESLWLGIKVEQRLQNREAVRQLGDQLRRRYPDSREFKAYERGTFDE